MDFIIIYNLYFQCTDIVVPVGLVTRPEMNDKAQDDSSDDPDEEEHECDV